MNDKSVVVGQQFNFYDGAGYWGNWRVTIVSVDASGVTYRAVNKLPDIEPYTATISIKDAQWLIDNDYWE